MNLPVRSFTDVVRDMSAAITASASSLIDISVGSVLRAILEANAAIALWSSGWYFLRCKRRELPPVTVRIWTAGWLIFHSRDCPPYQLLDSHIFQVLKYSKRIHTSRDNC